MGSSPASTPTKNSSGSTVPASGSSADPRRMTGPMPGTSIPIRFTISWNMRVWLHSSMTSWVQYRNSGSPLASLKTCCITPPMRIVSNCRPTLATLACRHMPIAIFCSSGSARYQG